jgi:hypothetical protein
VAERRIIITTKFSMTNFQIISNDKIFKQISEKITDLPEPRKTNVWKLKIEN